MKATTATGPKSPNLEATPNPDDLRPVMAIRGVGGVDTRPGVYTDGTGFFVVKMKDGRPVGSIRNVTVEAAIRRTLELEDFIMTDPRNLDVEEPAKPALLRAAADEIRAAKTGCNRRPITSMAELGERIIEDVTEQCMCHPALGPGIAATGRKTGKSLRSIARGAVIDAYKRHSGASKSKGGTR